MKINFLSKNNKVEDRGFTLLETLIAVGLLMVAVVGPLTIAQKALSSSYYSRDRITAYYLAQDAIEFVRSVRDNASLVGGATPWMDFQNVFAKCLGTEASPKICEFDTTAADRPSILPVLKNSGVSACSDGANDTVSSCRLMKYDKTIGSTGWYNYDDPTSSNQPSIFRRGISLFVNPNNNPDSADEVWVRVTVSWRSAIFGPTERSFTVQDNLFNWQ